MNHAYSSVPKCNAPHKCSNENEHFSLTTQLAFTLTTPPTCKHITLGTYVVWEGVASPCALPGFLLLLLVFYERIVGFLQSVVGWSGLVGGLVGWVRGRVCSAVAQHAQTHRAYHAVL